MLLAATDVGVPLQVPGLSLHIELERLVEASLSPLEALQAATRNPARVLRLADSLGSIETGKLADLVLLDADPLEDIRNTQKIRAVVADGRLYRRSDLDQLLAAAYVPREPVSTFTTNRYRRAARLLQPSHSHNPRIHLDTPRARA